MNSRCVYFFSTLTDTLFNLKKVDVPAATCLFFVTSLIYIYIVSALVEKFSILPVLLFTFLEEHKIIIIITYDGLYPSKLIFSVTFPRTNFFLRSVLNVPCKDMMAHMTHLL